MAIGFFGKLPSQGDFVSRRLPWEFTSAWDDWLQRGMARAKADLAGTWNERYLTAPLWRFQVAAGLIGPSAWVGLWFASVDRVGRQFPLCLVEPLPAGWQGRYTVIEQDEAYFALEDAALRALDPRLSFDAFDRLIEPMSLLGAPAMPASLVPQVLTLGATVTPAGPQPFTRLDADADAGRALAEAERSGGAQGCCFFTWGNEHHAPMLLRTPGLPSDGAFRVFLDGQWS